MESQATSVTERPPVLLLARLGLVMRRAFAEAMTTETWATEAGLKPGCFSVLRAVAAAPAPPSQRALSDQVGMDPSDLVGLLDVLERAGYLERARDPHDRRRHALRVTPEGEEAIGRFDEVAARVADTVFGVLPTSERAELEQLLDAVVNAHEAAS